MQKKLTREVENKFLLELANCGRLTEAAQKVGLHPQTIYARRRENPQFQACIELARKAYGELLEREAHRRAVDGVNEPVFYRGEVCGHMRRYSDALLQMMLKKHVPEFRDRLHVEADVAHRGVLVVSEQQTEEEWTDEFEVDEEE